MDNRLTEQDLLNDGWVFWQEGSPCNYYKKEVKKSWGFNSWVFQFGLGLPAWHEVYFHSLREKHCKFSGELPTLAEYNLIMKLIHVNE